jgi:multicomponent K+:H+ antiporter subunit E
MNRSSTTPAAPQVPIEAPAKWWPHPVVSALVGGSWLLLSQSLAPVHWLSAIALGFVIPRLVQPFLLRIGTVRWWPALRLTGVVLKDIVVSNVVVARWVLGPMDRLQPAWLEVPLACDHPYVNGLFAAIITTTPGTVTCVIDESRQRLLVHSLNCDDPAGSVQDMKNRYEAALMEVFAQSPATQAHRSEP